MKSERDDPDLPLLDGMIAGDPGALEQLYKRHRAYLRVYLLRLLNDHDETEETLQNLMVAIWRGAARFQRLSLVRTWMIAIARRQALKTMRKPTALPLDESLVASHEDLPTRYWEQQRIERLQAALLKLPKKEREALEFVYYEALTLALSLVPPG